MAGVLVLDSVDAETAGLILQLQLQDLASAEEEIGAQTTERLQDDQAIARGLFEDELKQYQISRKIELPPITKSTNLLPPKAPEPQIVRFNCNSCEDLFDADHCYPAPCQHYYCDGCMDNLFRLSLTDERIYPPRCCTTHYIPLDDVRLFLDKDLVIEFEAKKEELDDTKRTYCYVPTCSKYIGQSNKEGNTGTCPACAAQTCLLCKQAGHTGDCAEDKAMEQTMELAKKEGWQKCPSCGRMVELNTGCNHMTCLCRAQFCYVCGGSYQPKTCACPQFNEERLLARGREIAHREGGNLGRVMDNLRRNHGCTDHEWRFTHGAAQCEICRQTLPVFTFRCQWCRTQVCRRCRFNRM